MSVVAPVDPGALARQTTDSFAERRAAILAADAAPVLPCYPLTLSRAPVFVRVIPEGAITCEPVALAPVAFPLTFARDIGHGISHVMHLTGYAPIHVDGPDYAEGLADAALDLEVKGFVGTLTDVNGQHTWQVPAPRVPGLCAADPDGDVTVFGCHTCRNAGTCRDAV